MTASRLGGVLPVALPLVLAAAAAAAPARVVDRTLRCAGLAQGGVPVFDLTTEPGGPPPAPGASFPFVPAPSLVLGTGSGTALVALGSSLQGSRFAAHGCRAASPRPPLTARGLPRVQTVRLGDHGAFAWRCVDVAAVVLRVAIASDARGYPIRARLLVLRAGRPRPLLYVDWRRTLVTAFASPACA